ncbi:hypothetical protein [Aeromicrobium sp. A1-2]|uniref:hypothetical protein n=1 Tax=Aeromicrobium sp. A1-2 TaxID=2107713 RepID=UPI0013C2D8DD|nr:hypothetical protein [Aeromicrobium sp. A1-2]
MTEPDRFKQLPRRVRLADTVTSQETNPVPDPEGGRDAERDFMIRYGLGAL